MGAAKQSKAGTAPRSAAHCAVFALAPSWPLARALASAKGVPAHVIACHRFPDGETLVQVPARVAEQAIVVQRLHDPDAKLFPLLLVADALRRAGAQRVVLVAPYLPYMRQDAAFRPGEPISQRVLGRLLRLGFDRVLTVEPHLHRVQGLKQVVPGGEAISAAPAISEYLLRRGWRGVLVGPDAESARWVKAIACASGLPWMVGEKQRLGDRRVRISFRQELPSTAVMLVDDIASSGATLARAARGLRRMGAERVEAIVVHAIFAPGAAERMQAAGIARVVSCDTVPHRTNRIACAPLIAQAL
ncbi:MAG: ribose-phosphate diphosphokinase [Candidatus Binatia bacterium]|nr:ribose-phosphate diphosphokinase [Candidatus Binatia bacterium]